MKKDQQECYTWIQNIIDSCNNTFHFEGADRLIDLYQDQFKDDESTTLLKLQRQNHFNAVHNILN